MRKQRQFRPAVEDARLEDRVVLSHHPHRCGTRSRGGSRSSPRKASCRDRVRGQGDAQRHSQCLGQLLEQHDGFLQQRHGPAQCGHHQSTGGTGSLVRLRVRHQVQPTFLQHSDSGRSRSLWRGLQRLCDQQPEYAVRSRRCPASLRCPRPCHFVDLRDSRMDLLAPSARSNAISTMPFSLRRPTSTPWAKPSLPVRSSPLTRNRCPSCNNTSLLA